MKKTRRNKFVIKQEWYPWIAVVAILSIAILAAFLINL